MKNRISSFFQMSRTEFTRRAPKSEKVDLVVTTYKQRAKNPKMGIKLIKRFQKNDYELAPVPAN